MADGWTTLDPSTPFDVSNTRINQGFAELTNLHAGATAPVNIVAGMLWYDTGAEQVKMWDNTNAVWRVIVNDVTAPQGDVAFLSSATFSVPVSGVPAVGPSNFVTLSQVQGQTLLASIDVGGLGGDEAHTLLAVPEAGAMTVTGCMVVSDTATSGSTAGARWEFELRNVTQGSSLTGSPKGTDTEELASNAAWVVGVTQNNLPADLNAGDVLQVVITQTGSPTDLSAGTITLQLDYRLEAG